MATEGITEDYEVVKSVLGRCCATDGGWDGDAVAEAQEALERLWVAAWRYEDLSS